MIGIINAESYFASRTMGARWNDYSTEQKEAAIEQAKRDLSRAIGRPMREDEPQYRYGDTQRDEYAVYEQALYLLLRDCNPDVTGVVQPSADPDERQTPGHTLKSGRGAYSEEALAWLGAHGRVEIVMG